MWCLYAMKQQEKAYPTSGWIKLLSVAVGNAIFCPICILMAVIKDEMNGFKDQRRDEG